jgi:hypothetical protein
VSEHAAVQSHALALEGQEQVQPITTAHGADAQPQAQRAVDRVLPRGVDLGRLVHGDGRDVVARWGIGGLDVVARRRRSGLDDYDALGRRRRRTAAAHGRCSVDPRRGRFMALFFLLLLLLLVGVARVGGALAEAGLGLRGGEEQACGERGAQQVPEIEHGPTPGGVPLRRTLQAWTAACPRYSNLGSPARERYPAGRTIRR